MKAEIIAASVLVLRYPNAKVCEDCRGVIRHRALRVAEKRDGIVSVFYYHPYDEQDDGRHACAPQDDKVRAVLHPPRKTVPPIDHGGDDPYHLAGV